MNELLRCYDESSDYPNTVQHHQSYDHVLASLKQRLADRASSLFCEPGRAEVKFLQYDHAYLGFQASLVGTLEELRKQLRIGVEGPQLYDPKCQFV